MDNRKTTILEHLQKGDQVSVRELAVHFQVSEMTIRRDLDELERQGLAVRTHGGAISTGRLRFLQAGAGDDSHSSSSKTAIGQMAAGLVKPGQTVLIDTGTTALEVAKHLPQDQGITVATTSLSAAHELYGSDVNVLVLGGFLRKEFPSLYGPLTERLLNDIHVDVLYIGCDGADSSDGFYSNDLHIASIEQRMTRVAEQVVVVTESEKFGQKAFLRYATVQQVNTIVTDNNLSAADRANLESAGAKVLMV